MDCTDLAFANADDNIRYPRDCRMRIDIPCTPKSYYCRKRSGSCETLGREPLRDFSTRPSAATLKASCCPFGTPRAVFPDDYPILP